MNKWEDETPRGDDQKDVSHPFDTLTPGFLIDAVESLGFYCDGRLFPLNSYENRVYQVGIEDATPMIAKFYRPQRWSEAQIREEHEFCFELVKPFQHRPAITIEDYGCASVVLIGEQFIPASLKDSYFSLTTDLLQAVKSQFALVNDLTFIRSHGDCHGGNILWRDDTANFVDFDDARMAPAVQDLWMLLCGDRPRQTAQLSEVVEGYNEFFSFHPKELRLIEPLRTLRMLHYAAWLARRWTDPAFPRAFPWFNTERYWGEHILELREQYAALQEPPLTLF